jgi:hypothetical protein
MTSENISTQFKELFILDNINELQLQDRREILQMVYNSASRSKLKEKGSGTQINLEDISDILIEKIYTLMNEKLNEQDNIISL